MTLKQAEKYIGRQVIYKPYLGCGLDDHEYGVITSVNLGYVFVRFGRDLASKAVKPEDLEVV